LTENSPRPSNAPNQEAPLESWKEIAAYLKRDVRTVKRWEKSEGLPVRRHLHQMRSTVYAYPGELDAWWATHQPRLEPLARPWGRPARALTLTAILVLTLVSAGSGPIVTAPRAAGALAGAPGIVARQVWALGNADATGAPSPDGRYLSFVNWDTANLAVRDLTNGQNRDLTHEGTWEGPDQYPYYSIWSAKSNEIAYAWFNKDQYELRTLGLKGGQPRVVYPNPNREIIWIRPHTWSQDGRFILTLLRTADRIHQIALVAVADGSVRVLKTLDWRWPLTMSLSPDGRYVAYDIPPKENAPERDIFLLATDGSRELPLVEHPANDYGPIWTPDGRSLVFASDRSGAVGAWVIQVKNGQPDGTPRLVKSDMGRMMPMGFTREGSLYYGFSTLENAGNVYVATLDLPAGRVVAPPNRAIQRFEGNNTSPAWSPDGNCLA